MILLARKNKLNPSLDNPIFGDKKIWQAYWHLEQLASTREYRCIGLLYAVGYLVAQMGLSERKARFLMRRLSRFPFNWISADNGQITVIPMDEVLKRSGEGEL